MQCMYTACTCTCDISCVHAWQALETKQIPPPFPPKIKSDTDDSAFDDFGEDEGKFNYPEEYPRNGPHGDMFKDFADVWVP